MATFRPAACSSSISAGLSAGSTPARISSMPRRRGDGLAVRSLSPVAMMMRRPFACSALMALGGGLLDRVGDRHQPGQLCRRWRRTSPSCPRLAADRHRRRARAHRCRGRPAAPRCRAPRDWPSTMPLTPLPVTASKSLRRRPGRCRARRRRVDDGLGQRDVRNRVQGWRPAAALRLRRGPLAATTSVSSACPR